MTILVGIDSYIERRKKAQEAARIAAYGSALARTPADYTLQEALNAMTKDKPKKDKKGDEQPVDETPLGPMFESEADE